MNCRSAQRLISAERDGALPPGERTALEAHVAGCRACAELRHSLAAAASAWVAADRTVATPDVERAWQDIRRDIRRGADKPAPRRVAWWSRALLAGVPALGAAAVALVVWTRPAGQVAPTSAPSTWSQFVEVDAPSSTPMVIVDEDSGWIVVWAADTEGRQT